VAEQVAMVSSLEQRSAQRRSAASRLRGLLWLLVLLAATVVFALLNYLLFPVSGLPAPGWRYWVLPPVVLFLLFFIGARFVQVSYQLLSLRSAFRYLLASFIPFRIPTLTVSDGKIQVDSIGSQNLVQVIGGPGILNIQSGNVALLEGLDGQICVLGGGRHFLTNLEHVKEALSLEERADVLDKIAATSRDGVEVLARDVRFRYRLDSGGAAGDLAGRTPENPYPYLEQAVIRAVYNRNMGADLNLGEWHTGVKSVVDSVIADYIRQNQADFLTAHVKQARDPRSEIRRQLFGETGRTRFSEKGAELIWVDIGYFEAVEKVTPGHWMGSADVSRAYGDRQRLAYAEMGRAEAQAEMVMDIVHELEDVAARSDASQNLRTQSLASLSQLLAAMERQLVTPPEEPPRQ
jgi:hypothetical protein